MLVSLGNGGSYSEVFSSFYVFVYGFGSFVYVFGNVVVGVY